MIRLKDRYKTLEKYGFKCASCGATSKDDLLQIDHIIPKSKGGKDELNNYQVLCFRCNMGKSDNFEGLQRIDKKSRKKNKIRINIMIDSELKKKVNSQGLNLSKIMGDYLERVSRL